MFGIKGEIEPISREQCDFGKGFYMGTDSGQTLTLICDYEKSKFYIVSVNLDELANIEVPADIDWAMLVAYNRGKMEKINGTSFSKKYRDMLLNKDLVIGSIADDSYFSFARSFVMNTISLKQLGNAMRLGKLGEQFVLKSEICIRHFGNGTCHRNYRKVRC